MEYFFTIKNIDISKTDLLFFCYLTALITFIIYYFLFKNILKHSNDVCEKIKRYTQNKNFGVDFFLDEEFNKLPCHFKHIIVELQKASVSKEYLDNIFRNIIDALIVITPDKIIQKANQAACEMLNYKLDELVGHNVDKVFPDGRFSFDGSRNYEACYQTKDKTVIPVLLSVSRIRVNNKLKAIALTARDITEIKKVEHAIKKSERENKKMLSLMNAVIESTDNGILVVDHNQSIAKVNQRFLDILRISETHNFKDKTLFDYLFDRLTFPDDFIFKVQNLFHAAEEKSKDILHFNDGSIFTCYSRPMYIDDIPRGRVWCLHEITKERKHKLELIRIKTAIDSASEAIAISTDEGKHFYQNNSFTELFGYTLEEYKKLPLLACYNDQELTNEVFESIMKNDTWQGEIKAKTSSNKIFPALACVNTAKNDEGKIVGLIHTYVDITGQKQNEKQLQEALKKADELAVKAEAANAAKSKFLANVSHEIRTPMNGIIGMSDILLDTGLNYKQIKYAKIVRNSAKSLLSIINDILDFSKIEAGKLEIDKFDFNIYEMIETFATTMAFRLQEKNIEFICILEPGTPAYFRGDAGRIRQVLNNLVGNAIKFTIEGTIKVYGKVKKSTDKEITLFFSVQDTGIGIPADKKNKIFKTFFQVNDSLNREYYGTGLGLAISKQLVTIMGGTIEVHSEQDKGSKFCFTVKVSPSHKQIEPFKCEHLKDHKFLVIDYNKSSLEIIKKQLNYWHIICDTASNASAGLEKLQEGCNTNNKFDVAIIDYEIPGIDCEKLGKLIKNNEQIKNTKLVMIKKASTSKPGDTKRLRNIGFSACIEKPIKQSELFNAITKVLGISHISKDKKQKNKDDHYKQSNKQNIFKILVVEDNITNQHVIQALLEKIGHQPDIVSNGKEAISCLKTSYYDIIFMDIQMPVMDGIEAAKKIREQKLGNKNGNIPIIAVTAHAMKGDQEKFINAGMDDYISKPISLKRIVTVLDKWLSKDKPSNTLVVYDKQNNMEKAGSEKKDEYNRIHKIFDKNNLLERLIGDEHLVKILAKEFLEDIPQQIDNLKTAILESNQNMCIHQSHKIKGAALNISAIGLSELAYKIEKISKEHCNTDELRKYITLLEDEFAELKLVLEKELN